MHRKATILSAVLILGLTASGFVGQTPADQTPAGETPAANTPAAKTSTGETLAVEQAIDQFYTSLNALLAGDAASMEQIWLHADDVTYLGPTGGIDVGWEQVQKAWERQAERKLGGHVEPMGLHVTLGKDIAIVDGYELGSIGNAQGWPRTFRIRATSSLRKEYGQWKMISHHTDPLDLDRGAGKASNKQPSRWQMQPDPTRDADSIIVSEDEVILKLGK